MNSPVVSILIVSWNTREVLRDCLRTVYEQTKNVPFEVIVVDNASEDGSVDMVKTAFPQAVLLANTTNRGFAAANNQGIEVAQGRYVLLLNSDTLVLDGAIDKTVDFAQAHPEAAVIACRVLNSDRTWQPTCFMFPSALNILIGALYLNKLFARSRFFGRERMTWWDGRDVRAVDVVTGCFMLVRREAIEQVGVLDESYFMYGEESDWCYRFHKAGWKVALHAGCRDRASGRSQQCPGQRSHVPATAGEHSAVPPQASQHGLLCCGLSVCEPVLPAAAASVAGQGRRIGQGEFGALADRANLRGRVLAGLVRVARPVCEKMSSCRYVLVTPAYNEGRFIGKTIEGVLAQTQRPVRWVIVDDGSTDDTWEVVRRYAEQAGFIEACQRRRDANETYYGNNVYAILQGYARVKDLDFRLPGHPGCRHDSRSALLRGDLPSLRGESRAGDCGGDLCRRDRRTSSGGPDRPALDAEGSAGVPPGLLRADRRLCALSQRGRGHLHRDHGPDARLADVVVPGDPGLPSEAGGNGGRQEPSAGQIPARRDGLLPWDPPALHDVQVPPALSQGKTVRQRGARTAGRVRVWIPGAGTAADPGGGAALRAQGANGPLAGECRPRVAAVAAGAVERGRVVHVWDCGNREPSGGTARPGRGPGYDGRHAPSRTGRRRSLQRSARRRWAMSG